MYVRGEPILHRDTVSSNDSAFPSTKSGNIGNLQHRKLILEIKIGGTDTPTWTITPGYWSTNYNAYCSGDSISVSYGASGGYGIVEVDTLGAPDIYIKCDSSAGTSPTITIYAIPIDIP